jgi:hypothetical protein
MSLLFAEVDKYPGSLEVMIWQAVSAVSWWTPKSDVEGRTLFFGRVRNTWLILGWQKETNIGFSRSAALFQTAELRKSQ